MSICVSKQVLEVAAFVLIVFQRFEGFEAAQELFPDPLILAKVLQL